MPSALRPAEGNSSSHHTLSFWLSWVHALPVRCLNMNMNIYIQWPPRVYETCGFIQDWKYWFLLFFTRSRVPGLVPLDFEHLWYSEVFMRPELRCGILRIPIPLGGIFGQPSGENTFSKRKNTRICYWFEFWFPIAIDVICTVKLFQFGGCIHCCFISN